MKFLSSPQAGAHVIASIVVLGFVSLMIVLALHVVVESTLMVTLAGIMGSKFSSVVDYYLGSSMGEAVKSSQISHLIGQTGTATAASESPPAGA